MKTEDLKIFLHLSSSLSFAKTSQNCYMSASTLSRVIQRMEGELGHRLFERDNRRVLLTEKGETFQQYAMETLARWEGIRLELDQEEGLLQGEIKIYCSVTSAYSMLPSILSLFRRSYPQIRIDLEVGNVYHALSKLKEGEADVIVGAIPEKADFDISRKLLGITPLVFIAPKESRHLLHYEQGHQLDWNRIPLILLKKGTTRDRLNQWLRKQEVSPLIYGEMDSNEAIIVLTALGCGIGFLPLVVLEKSPLRSQVKILDVNHNIEGLAVSLAMRKRSQEQAKLRAFWESVVM